jgi:cytochrome c553
MTTPATFRLAALLVATMGLVACGDGTTASGVASATTVNALPDGRIAAGEQLANVKGAATGQSCIDCHGADGNVPLDPTYPKLGGQYRDYLAHALQTYRSGARDHALMSSQARGLDDQQIADLAAYFASRPGQLRDLPGAHAGK